MVIEFVIEKLEAHWNQIEIELGPSEWAQFAREYRAVAALDALDTETFICKLRELMTSRPCTKRLWEEWREEANFPRIRADLEVWGRSQKRRAQRLEQLGKRYRALGASSVATPPALAPNALNSAPVERV